MKEKLNLFHLIWRILILTDKEAMVDFFQGLVTVFVILLVFVAFIVALSRHSPKSTPLEIVDKYENCDVVRYVDPSNRYHYFLHCPKAP